MSCNLKMNHISAGIGGGFRHRGSGGPATMRSLSSGFAAATASTNLPLTLSQAIPPPSTSPAHQPRRRRWLCSSAPAPANRLKMCLMGWPLWFDGSGAGGTEAASSPRPFRWLFDGGVGEGGWLVGSICAALRRRWLVSPPIGCRHASASRLSPQLLAANRDKNKKKKKPLQN